MDVFIVKGFMLLGLTTILSLSYSGAVIPGYRLPHNIKPKHYIVDMVTNLEEGDFTFHGKVWIKVLVERMTDTVIMHSKSLNITESEVTVKEIIGEDKVYPLKITDIHFVPEHEFLVIRLDKNMNVGKYYIVQIPFAGELTESLAGYYRSSYIDKMTNSTKWLAVTQFESIDARRAFPCFDEPAMKAQFTINMGHKADLKSVSNMPLISTTPMEGRDGWVWDKYDETVPMSTYLVAFMVSEFEYKAGIKTDNNVMFRIWARKDALQQVEFASQAGPKFLEYFEEYFNVKYPLPKQDMVAIPDFSAGAMENWGLITYRETALLFDEKSSSAANKQSIANVIAHELAHQWFGNLVTMRWWTDLWLNEGFATYVASLGVHKIFPEWNTMDGNTVDDALSVFSLDSLKSSHPVSVKIGNPNEIAQIFDSISYKKGSYLLRMMNLFLGEEVFRNGVTNYLNAHRFSNAEQDDLWESLTKAAHEAGTLKKELTVKEVMDTWTLQTGYPLINVTRDYEKGTATIGQSRYLAVKPTAKDNEKSCWWVPISYTTQFEHDFQGTSPKLWISCKEGGELLDVGKNDEWLILNIQMSGLYRVQYDDMNWRNLINTLNSNDYKNIGTLNRVQLLADALEFAWSGDLDYNLAFSLISYLKSESDYLPWKTGLSGLNKIERLLRRTASYGEFKKYMRTLISPIFERFNKLTEIPTSYEEVKFKSLITHWACQMQTGDCVEQALELFKNWKNGQDPDSNNPIPADMRQLVYCLGVKHGGENEWNYLFERYKNSNVGTEQSMILGGLACSKEVWILNRYLEMTIDAKSPIRRQDSDRIFGSIARNEVGYFVAKTFFYNNAKRIHEFFGPNSNKLGRYVSSVSDQMISNEEVNELKRNLELNKDILQHSALAVKQSLESTLVNIRWFTNFHSTVLRVVTQ